MAAEHAAQGMWAWHLPLQSIHVSLYVCRQHAGKPSELLHPGGRALTGADSDTDNNGGNTSAIAYILDVYIIHTAGSMNGEPSELLHPGGRALAGANSDMYVFDENSGAVPCKRFRMHALQHHALEHRTPF